MNPYATLGLRAGDRGVQRLVEELGAWHDEMVMHQRDVRLRGAREACSEECPHAEGRRLWREASALLGPGANDLRFLRSCAAEGSSPRTN